MNRSKQLGEEKILKLLIKFSIPAIIGMLVNALYNVVDRIFIGNGVGSLGIAGITIGFPIMIIIMAFSMLFGIGATSLISLRLGEGKKDEAELIMGNGLVLLLIISVIISALGLYFIEPLLILFGASEEVLPYSIDYMNIILWGVIFQSIGFGVNGFIRAEGNPRTSMYTMLIAGILNIILDPIFIFVFDLGIKGAAYATILSQAVAATWVLYYFISDKSYLKFKFKNSKISPAIVKAIVAIGLAPFSMQLASSLVNVILNKSLAYYGGDIALSTIGIISSFSALIVMPIFGINQGVQPIIGYNYGARNYDRVKKALGLAIIGATLFVSLGFIITRIFPEEIIMLFNKDNQELIEFGTYAIKIFLLLLPIIGFQIVGANYFQAVGKPGKAMFLSLSRQVIILIPAILILPLFFGLDGILYAMPLSDLGSATITGILLYKEIKFLNNSSLAIEDTY